LRHQKVAVSEIRHECTLCDWELALLVSVIIPAFNAEKWIKETLESVLTQTYGNIEVIVVDDGSNDGTPALAEQALAEDARSHMLIQQPNQGAAAARNRGIEAASGDWIQFLDADDLLDRQKIEIQVERLTTGCATDVVYSDWRKLVWTGNAWNVGDVRKPILQSDALADVLSDRNFLQLGCMLFRKSALQTVGGFDTDHEPIEDVGLCVKIAIAGGQFLKAPSACPLASYRDLPKSFSKRSHRKFIESCIKNAKLAEAHVQADASPAARSTDAIVDVYYAGARYYAGLDWDRFDELVGNIEALQPNFIPRTPARLRILSRIAGYRGAERIAALYRRGRRSRTGILPDTEA
jgi:glycosyltransferase involved in cell wall biosynthesis